MRTVVVLLLCGGLSLVPTRACAQAAQQPASAQPDHKGTVLFSRSSESTQDATDSKTTSAPSLPVQTPDEIKTIATQNAERSAITVSALDLDVHLHTVDQGFAARAGLTIRNDGAVPLTHVLLQISSTLHWDQIRLGNATGSQSISFTQSKIKSDVDHTGMLNESTISLAQPLAVGTSLALDLNYSGIVPQSADRLTAIGTPDDVAQLSDWDRISSDFTGLRGFGNVVWYPVASTPVFLGDGSKLFDEIGAHRLRSFSARFNLKLTVEFQPGHTPTVALINGRPAALTVTNANADAEVAGIARASIDNLTLGFDEPSLFVAIRSEHVGTNLKIYSRSQDESNLEPWTIAALDLSPFIRDWLGKPQSELTILDLPESGDAPFETGALLATPITNQSPAQFDALDGTLAHALTHAWIAASNSTRPAWLNEGLAYFVSTLWVEKQHTRNQALRMLESARPALALVEPESPGSGDGQSLNVATSPVYYRTKAAYVFWMLRDLIGDGNLKTALHNYIAGKDASSDGFEKCIEKNSQSTNNLRSFFADWIDQDKGLPDLTIDGVFSNTGSTPDSWLVAVNISNAGYVAAEVPVTVRSQSNTTTERILIPARGKITAHILIIGKPTEAQVNDGTVPESQASVHVTKLQ